MTKMEKVARIVILMFLVVFFGIEVRDGLSKFFGKRTTLVKSKFPRNKAHLPIVSFCPGFKSRNLTKVMTTYFDAYPEKGLKPHSRALRER